MKNKITKNDIINLCKLLNLEPVTVILYGSQKNDLDFFIIEKTGEYRTYKNKEIDCAIISKAEMYERCLLRDIAFTEPILSGSVVYGSEIIFNELFNEIKEVHFDNNIIVNYLLSRSHVEFYNADSFKNSIKNFFNILNIQNEYKNHKTNPIIGNLDFNVFRSFFDTIAYSYTYLISSRHYSVNTEPFYFSSLLNDNIIKQIKNLKHKEISKLDIKKIEELFYKIQKIIFGSSNS